MMKEKFGLSAPPPGWTWTCLEDCVDILDSQRVPVSTKERKLRCRDKTAAERFPHYGATGQVGWIDGYLFDEELILLGEDGAPFLDPSKDKAYIIRGKSWVNNHAHVLRAIEGLGRLCVCGILAYGRWWYAESVSRGAVQASVRP